MPKRKAGSVYDFIFQAALFILVLWMFKMILNIDPPLEELWANIPWVAVVFSAGALYMKVNYVSKDVEEMKRDLKKIRDTVNQLKGKVNGS